MTPFASAMRDLYQRLSRAGFDEAFVRSAILPDWWEDELASVPFNRALAEALVASHLPLAVAKLRDPAGELTLPEPSGVCFKRNRGLGVSRCAPSLAVVRRAASLVASAVPDAPPFIGRASAAGVRAKLLTGGGSVDLKSLVNYSWSIGVPVIPVARLPKQAVKFDGAALWCESRPLIVLASGRDGPPWLAFDLAHELGHVLLGHVSSGSDTHIDRHLGDGAEDAEERGADQFALELLTGKPQGLPFAATYGLTAPKLADAARRYASGSDTDPGIVCLFYARSAGRWGAGQAALELLSLAHGGHELLADALLNNLRLDELTESSARFLEATCHLPTNATDDTTTSVR